MIVLQVSYLTKIEKCQFDCNNNGECENGECKCNEYYFGTFCEKKKCKNDCFNFNNQGICDEKSLKCICKKGFTGDDCSIELCPNNCNNFNESKNDDDNDNNLINNEFRLLKRKQYRNTNKNISDEIGEDINQGICTETGCKCYKGFFGKDCSLKSCPIGILKNFTNEFKSEIISSNLTRVISEVNINESFCSGNGQCDFNTGLCECPLGFKGEACQEKYCYNNCHENGYCSLGECHCKPNYYGQFCEFSKYL